MVLRLLFQMVLNFQIAIFTKFLQTLVLPHNGHTVKPNPNPGCFEVSEWFCLWLYFDHPRSVISKIKRFGFTRCELSACIRWAFLKTAEVAAVGHSHRWEYPMWASLDINSRLNISHLMLEENYQLVTNQSLHCDPPMCSTEKWNTALPVVIRELGRSKLRAVIWILWSRNSVIY